MLEAIERIEIHARSSWTYRLDHAHGSHAHLDHNPFTAGAGHPEQLARLGRAVKKSGETFISHYRDEYTEPYGHMLQVNDPSTF